MGVVLDERQVRCVVLLPKNRGLAVQAARALERRGPLEGTVASVRGEDMGALASEAARSGCRVLAITGDDLLDEWLAAGNTLDPALKRVRMSWQDADALYGAPALCVVAASASQLERSPMRLAICSRYARLAEPYVERLERRVGTVVRRYVQGALETVVGTGLADAAIDIVVTGRSIRASGLCVVEVLSRSHLAVLETR